MAGTLGVRSETVANWERGLGRPLVRHRPGIVGFLGSDPEPPAQTLAGRLRAARFRLGLTQEQIAFRLGLDEGSVCRWENGRRSPASWMATRLSALLDALEHDEKPDGATASLSFFDLTRWSRQPPTGLLASKPKGLGDRIRDARLQRGLSQEQAGDRFGVGRATVYRWERGSSAIPRTRIEAVRRFIGESAKRAEPRPKRRNVVE